MLEKLRAILDTNVYGWIVAYDKRLGEVLIETEKIQIYGFEVIRKELRAIPKVMDSNSENVRMDVLKLYDKLVKEHYYQINSLIEKLANEYLSEYRGNISKKSMLKDFQIVACASIHRLDIIVSEDQHTMCSALAKEAFETINRKNELPTPKFYQIKDLNQLL